MRIDYYMAAGVAELFGVCPCLPPDNDPRPVPQEAGRGTIEPPQTLQE